MNLKGRIDKLFHKSKGSMITLKLHDGGEWLLSKRELVDILNNCIEANIAEQYPDHKNIEKVRQVIPGQNKTIDICRTMAAEFGGVISE